MGQSAFNLMQRETIRIDFILDLLFINSSGLVISIGNTPGCEPSVLKNSSLDFQGDCHPFGKIKRETAKFVDILMQHFTAYTGGNGISETWDAIDKHEQNWQYRYQTNWSAPCTGQPWLFPSSQKSVGTGRLKRQNETLQERQERLYD